MTTNIRNRGGGQSGKTRRFSRKSLILAVSIAPLLATPSFAQVEDEAAEPEAGSRRLATVTVEARRREESIQDVPVVVQAFDADLLEAFSTAEFKDLNDLVSGLTIYADGTNQPSINLRGVQGNAINAAGDDPVSVNLDGIQHSSSQIFRFGLFDLEAVEVLKGPQALFFGKNSPGGVVALRTKNPTEELYTEFQAGYEFAGERMYGHGIISGPLSENWGARVGVRYADQEGYFENIWGDGDPTATQPINEKGPDFEELMVLGTLRGEFERGEITLKALHGTREGGQYNQVQLINCNPNIDVVNPFSDCTLDDRFSTAPFVIDPSVAPSFAPSEPSSDYSLTQFSLDGELELNENWSVNSITGLVDIKNTSSGNVGARPTDIRFGLGLAQVVEVESISQEIRFNGDYERLRLMFGGYADSRESSQRAIVYVSPTRAINPDAISRVEGDSWSVFAQAEYDLTDAFSVSLGGRYTEEDRSTKGENIGSLGSIPAGDHLVDPDEISASNFSPEATLTWRATDDVSFFASYKEGFKSGGFNNSVLDRDSTTRDGVPIDDSFKREDVEGFELGWKSEWFNNTLRINGAIFSYDYTELQQSSFFTDPVSGAVVVRTANAGEAEVRGFEADLLWATPVEGLTMTGNIAYNDSEFGNYVSVCNEYQLWVDPTGCDVDVDNDVTTWAGNNNPNNLVAGTGFDAQDRAGDTLRRAPEWAGSVGLSYDTSLSSALRFRANGLLSYSGEYYGNGENNPLGIQDSYVTVNTGLGIYAENGGWDLDLNVRNLTDEAYALTTFDTSRSAGSPATTSENLGAARNAPRQIFLQLTVRPQALFN